MSEDIIDKDFEETDDFQELSGEDVKTEKAEEIKLNTPLNGMYQNWFLDYASYVILERAVPLIDDGLKPVQRRILHSMYELEDGRYNKVANIIGNTMKYHPHGDASISEAIVQLGQKDLLIDTQGNWGNIFTGDRAAAPRYIEARLSKFALEVVFSPKITEWMHSYDGRNLEPVALPVKFPLLLAQGVEGIAVGLASKILPHNFNELIDASIEVLKGNDFELYPDFPTGGMIDVTRYNDGQRGGKVRVRAKIVQVDKKTLAIKDLPFGMTTTTLIESIVAANDKGKIKIKKIEDNTAENVEIILHLHPTVSPDLTIDALYAFTSCEISISPNTCVIDNKKPRFLGVKEILKISTEKTVELLKAELTIEKNELLDKLHFASLEKIFIEKEIYQQIKKCKTLEEIISTVHKGLEPYTKKFIRPVTDEDVKRLVQIPIIRISKYDSDKADENMERLKAEIDEISNHLDNLIDFAINYFRQLKKKYGKGRERKTEIRQFDVIQAAEVAVANQKLYVNREEGFVGIGLTKDEYVCDCSDIDDIIAFREDGKFMVSKVAEKVYMGKGIIHVDVFRKNDERTIYNMIYRDGKTGVAMVKRFAVVGITRDKEYDLTMGTEGSKVLHFSANPNGETEILKIYLKPRPKLRKTIFDFEFSSIAVKGRNAKGNILTRFPIHKIQVKGLIQGVVPVQKIWFDDAVKRLTTEESTTYLGVFRQEDKIITVMQSGTYRLHPCEMSTHFDDDMIDIRKYNPKLILTAVYYDAENGVTMIKRFNPEPTDKKQLFITESEGSKLLAISYHQFPQLEINYNKGREKATEIINVDEFIEVRSVKAKGKKLCPYKINKVAFLEPLKPDVELEEPEDISPDEIIQMLRPDDLELPNGTADNVQQITLEFDENSN